MAVACSADMADVRRKQCLHAMCRKVVQTTPTGQAHFERGCMTTVQAPRRLVRSSLAEACVSRKGVAKRTSSSTNFSPEGPANTRMLFTNASPGCNQHTEGTSLLICQFVYRRVADGELASLMASKHPARAAVEQDVTCRVSGTLRRRSTHLSPRMRLSSPSRGSRRCSAPAAPP